VAEPVEATSIKLFSTAGVSMLRQAQQPQAQRPRFTHRILRWLSLSKPPLRDFFPQAGVSTGSTSAFHSQDSSVAELVEATTIKLFLQRAFRQAQRPRFTYRILRWLSLSKPPP